MKATIYRCKMGDGRIVLTDEHTVDGEMVLLFVGELFEQEEGFREAYGPEDHLPMMNRARFGVRSCNATRLGASVGLAEVDIAGVWGTLFEDVRGGICPAELAGKSRSERPVGFWPPVVFCSERPWVIWGWEGELGGTGHGQAAEDLFSWGALSCHVSWG